MSALEILERAMALLREPGAWLKGDYSDAPLGSEHCTCFCVAGAIIHAAGLRTSALADLDEGPVVAALSAFAGAAGIEVSRSYHVGKAFDLVTAIADWQDLAEREHQHVLEALAKAVAALGARI